MTDLFRTERLLVRRLGPQDLDAMFAVYGDPRTQVHVGDGVPLDRDECQGWIDVTERNYATRGYGMSAIEEGGEVVGFIGIVHPSGQPEPEVKYALRLDAWGRGIATEAVDGILRWAAEDLGHARVVATIASRNAASQSVMRKVGAEHLATLRDPDGGLMELFVWRPS